MGLPNALITNYCICYMYGKVSKCLGFRVEDVVVLSSVVSLCILFVFFSNFIFSIVYFF